MSRAPSPGGVQQFIQCLCKCRQLSIQSMAYDSEAQILEVRCPPSTIALISSQPPESNSIPTIDNTYTKLNTVFVRKWLSLSGMADVSHIVLAGTGITRHGVGVLRSSGKHVTLFSTTGTFFNF